jgi:surface protein
MKLSAFAPVFLFSLGTLTACGGGGDDAAPETTPDITAPVITLNGESSLTHSAGTEYTDSGATANDAIDGSVDVTTTGAVDSDVVKSYTLTYTATDAAGNSNTATRTVNVIDDVAPVLVLNGVTPVAHNAGDDYTDLGVVATDNVDDTSEITITTSGSVNTAVIASYTVTYTATDAAGNAATPVTRIVNVVDVTAPVITLNGEAVIEHNYGDVYTDAGATAIDGIDGNIDATTSDTILIDKIGSYGITYTATDAAGNEAVGVERTVKVVDLVGPVISLNGGNTITLGKGRVYKELGATALDNVDGEMTLSAPTGTVDNTIIGQNTLTYSITDAAGNTSSLERIIEVVAPRPFITTWKTDNPGFSGDDTIKITTDTSTHSGTYNYSVDWGDGSVVETNLTGDATHTYASVGTYTVTISGDFPQTYFEYGLGDDSRKLLTIEQWGDIEWLSMYQGFSDCRSLVINDTEAPLLYKATDLSYMFLSAINLNQSLNHWDVSTITTIEGMFASAASFNGDISDWDVSSVTTMEFMFEEAPAFNIDISGWVVSSVLNMDFMFKNSLSFDQNLGGWDVSLVSGMYDMFKNITLSTANYDALLTGWSTQSLQSNVQLGAANSQYSPSSQAAKNILTSAPNNWTITDGGVTP